ncbi:MAG TPA: c-type cytochrome [Burkholderiaceae bacterium]|nr:c-type cytochrome [Burkholderiaceae bacterium]
MKPLIALSAAVACAAALLEPALADEFGIAKKAGCLACHAVDANLVGPSYRQIAAKYKGNAAAPAMLAERVRKGSKGVWGPTPMTPNVPARISDADLKAVIAWVLKQ